MMGTPNQLIISSLILHVPHIYIQHNDHTPDNKVG